MIARILSLVLLTGVIVIGMTLAVYAGMILVGLLP